METLKKLAVPMLITAATVALIWRVERIRRVVIGA